MTLLSAGFSICGAAAVAAVNDAVNARQRDVALAVALVTVYGSGMIVVVPLLADWLGLSDRQAAIWAGASIHEVAQVVAAGSAIGGGAIGVALTVKLGRVALLAPLYTVAARGSRTAGGRVPVVPWFLTGFAIAVTVRSSGLVPGVSSAFSTSSRPCCWRPACSGSASGSGSGSCGPCPVARCGWPRPRRPSPPAVPCCWSACCTECRSFEVARCWSWAAVRGADRLSAGDREVRQDKQGLQ
ncbi:putative sulfate exporter family transporter [Streptomyces tuirus]|uniref:Sulfate exporter family transporter n=1 Tax=Streptomyces tuirus TaxID=68278 RepID=A0A941FI37_9ACTN|nr:putative sulfate exporter family transporter [Streptomyces tuirus]